MLKVIYSPKVRVLASKDKKPKKKKTTGSGLGLDKLKKLTPEQQEAHDRTMKFHYRVQKENTP